MKCPGAVLAQLGKVDLAVPDALLGGSFRRSERPCQQVEKGNFWPGRAHAGRLPGADHRYEQRLQQAVDYQRIHSRHGQLVDSLSKAAHSTSRGRSSFLFSISLSHQKVGKRREVQATLFRQSDKLCENGQRRDFLSSFRRKRGTTDRRMRLARAGWRANREMRRCVPAGYKCERASERAARR